MINKRNRGWLNPINSYDNGWYKWSVYSSKNSSWEGTSADFMLADCSRTITLNFDYDTEKEKKQKLKKVRMLIEELEVFEDYLSQGLVLQDKKTNKR